MVYNFPLSLLIFRVNFSLLADDLALVNSDCHNTATKVIIVH